MCDTITAWVNNNLYLSADLARTTREADSLRAVVAGTQAMLGTAHPWRLAFSSPTKCGKPLVICSSVHSLSGSLVRLGCIHGHAGNRQRSLLPAGLPWPWSQPQPALSQFSRGITEPSMPLVHLEESCTTSVTGAMSSTRVPPGCRRRSRPRIRTGEFLRGATATWAPSGAPVHQQQQLQQLQHRPGARKGPHCARRRGGAGSAAAYRPPSWRARWRRHPPSAAAGRADPGGGQERQAGCGAGGAGPGPRPRAATD
jgi:hypothetical protein